MTLPRLELAELDTPFDEALILIEGREEETIRLDCTGAAAIAAHLVLIVNQHRATAEALRAAMHALRSYQCGNASTELAKSIADRCETALTRSGAA